ADSMRISLAQQSRGRRTSGLSRLRHHLKRYSVVSAALLAVATLIHSAAASGQPISSISLIPNGVFFPNPGGASQTYSTTGAIDLTGPFFQSLGSNGRSCGTCHLPSDGMAI